jgi:hypothetical protein
MNGVLGTGPGYGRGLGGLRIGLDRIGVGLVTIMVMVSFHMVRTNKIWRISVG